MANILGNHAVGILTINCPDRSNKLKINSPALSQTKSATDTLNIQNCNLSQLNWAFLNGFLTWLRSAWFFLQILCPILHLPFRLTNKALNPKSSVKFPEPLPNGITNLAIEYGYNLGDVATDRFLSQWIVPSSNNALLSLSLSGNLLTKIPPSVSKLNAA